jgi:TPP-dependent pyruvate/acetoin dehydrogenase alpha subunit
MSNDLPNDMLIEFWRDMVRIRAFERAAVYQSSLGKIYGALHSCEGQESCAVGVCAALDIDDSLASTHRGHGHCLAKGARMDRMMAELFGRATGYCKGKGGSLHIADFSVGMLGANGIVGAGYAIAAGAALRHKRAGKGRVAVAFFGDGATTRGTFHEVMNLASLWKLPLLMVCENNSYAQYLHWSESMVFEHPSDLAGSYHMPGVRVDGNDIRAVYQSTKSAVDRARAGQGPTLIELKTQRFTGHSSGDPQVYRTKAVIESLRRERDPVAKLEAELTEAGLLAERDAMLDVIDKEVADAVAFADASPYPQPDEVSRDVFAETQ